MQINKENLYMTLTKEQKQELCCQCGECCKWVVFYIVKPDLPSVAEEWFKARGITVLKKGQRRWTIKAHSWCNNLVQLGDGTYKCDIYDSRPHACKVYDGRLAGDEINCKWRNSNAIH